MDMRKTRVNTELAKEGVWVPLDDASRLKIAQWLNPQHKKYIQNALDPYQRALRTGTMDPIVSERIEAEAIAHTILLDWENMEDGGVPVPYSVEQAARWLRDPEISWFTEFVKEQSMNMKNFRDAVLDAEIESVGKPSNGNSTGEG